MQTIGPRKEILSQARKLADEIGGFIYGEDENGGTNTVYVSPVPFKVLNQAVSKGQGRPHLKAVDDAMADVNMLAGALVAAPVAGAIGAVLRLKQLAESKPKADKPEGSDGDK